MGCAHSKVAVKISASGKTFDFQGFKIVGAATDQIKGSVGILVAAPNVTIVGGGTGSKSGIEYFDYCLMDEGDSDGLTVSTLRCFRARSAGIDLASDNVALNGLLVDLVVAGTNTTTEVPGGIGMHLSGSANVKDSIGPPRCQHRHPRGRVAGPRRHQASGRDRWQPLDVQGGGRTPA